MDSWRQQYQLENEDEALVKALELSRLEQQGSQRAQTQPTVEPLQTEFQRTTQALGPDLKRKTGRNSQAGTEKATPLCLPNNFKWDPSSGHYIKTGKMRTSLYVVDEALENLRRIKGPVCVVSIAGPYRKGKSFVLSEAFNQPQVFPLGHHMVPETMGIWLWIVPDKFRDAKGQEITIVLLDSEGIDAVTEEGRDDNQIFTLTVLLASVLIYNSQGVPTRSDLKGLDFIVKLTHRIEVQSTTKQETKRSHRDSEYFHKTFPFFIWLLRDVTQAIPKGCSNVKDYFLKKVFKVQDSSAVDQESQKVAESILSFFPGFEAFALPPPTVDREVLKNITENKSVINPLFISGLEDFRSLVRRILLPKNSVNDGELLTGEGLAVLVQLYVQAINTPGMVPNIPNAWDQYVEGKCSDAMRDALNTYDTTISLQLKDKLPCDSDRLRNGHGMALENSEAHFMADMAGTSTNTIEMFLKNLKESLSQRFRLWRKTNAEMTREFCNNLLAMLKKQHLDPVIQQLQGKEGAKLSFHEIIGKYNLIKDDYHKSAIGAKDEIEAVFFEFHPALMKEQEQYMSLLQQLKDYDERLTKELAAKAFQEQEKQKLEEQQQRLLQENRQVKREMEMLSERQNEERKKFREQMDNDLRVQRDQMNNMMDANMQQAQREREQFLQENQQIQNQFLDMQKRNEENFKMIKKLSKLVERQEEEKRREEEKMERTQAAMEKKEKFEKMEARHREEKESLRREMEEKLERQRQVLTEEYQKAAQSRMQMVEEIGKKLEDVEDELKEVKKPGFIKRAAIKVKDAIATGARKVEENCVVM